MAGGGGADSKSSSAAASPQAHDPFLSSPYSDQSPQFPMMSYSAGQPMLPEMSGILMSAQGGYVPVPGPGPATSLGGGYQAISSAELWPPWEGSPQQAGGEAKEAYGQAQVQGQNTADPTMQGATGLGLIETAYDTGNGNGSGSGSGKNPHVSYQSLGSNGTTTVGNEEEDEEDDDLAKKYSNIPTDCSARRDVYTRRGSWLSVTILILSVYSTALSGVWLVVAFTQPRWGRRISTGPGGLSPSTASLLIALLAKTIEMSFVTVFVAFVGQVLTRRSFIRGSRGMTIAEMTMRNWVVQPGSLLTHMETVRSASATALGVITLVAAVAAMFYTTASDAMVSPKLKYGDWQHRVLSGYVMASYADPYFVKDNCPTPVGTTDVNAGESCLDVQFAGDSYHNLLTFMSNWSAINVNGTSLATDMAQRPVGTASLYDNITLTGTWVETANSNVTASWQRYARLVNNVTMAMPHPGVFAAATNPVNNILQPSDLSGIGEYAISASVVSPTVNVMCVNMARDELAPLVYTAWPSAHTNNASSIPGQQIPRPGWQGDVPVAGGDDEWLNATAVDEIFRWGEAFQRRPPVFPMFPIDYNIITNTSVLGPNADAVYLLGKNGATANYTLCALRSWVAVNCSTHFSVSGTNGLQMGAHCEDGADADSYARSEPGAPLVVSQDWKNLVDEWRLALDLDGGATNSNASNARILTELALSQETGGPSGLPALPDLLPSMAEALAVLSSSTLVAGSLQTTFRHYWAYPANALGAPGQLEPFNASVRTQEYASAHTDAWQAVFYAVLLPVVAVNLVCLAYLLAHGGGGLVTDFTEPANLFGLALGSPASRRLRGSCGAGPRGGELFVPWRVAYAPSANHYYFAEAGAGKGRRRGGDGGGSGRSTAHNNDNNDNPDNGNNNSREYIGLDLDDGDSSRSRKRRSGKSSYKRLSGSKAWL